MDFIPDESAINLDSIEVDKDTLDMLRSLGLANLPGVSVAAQGRQEHGGPRPARDFQQQRPDFRK
jgi:small subunit ribosomal protein S17e